MKSIYYLLGFALLVTTASAFPRTGRDDYNAEVDLHDYQKIYRTPEDLEADMVVSMLPGAITKNYIKLSRTQTLAALELMKSIMKPIIKSKEFRYSMKTLEELVVSLRDNPMIKINMKQAIDAVQEMWDRTDRKVINELILWTVSQYTDMNTARSITSIWSHISPAVNEWVVEPVLNYYKAWLSPTMSSFKHGMDEFFGEDVSVNAMARSNRWSDYLDAYVGRLAELTHGARSMLESTAEFLEMQDSTIEA